MCVCFGLIGKFRIASGCCREGYDIPALNDLNCLCACLMGFGVTWSALTHSRALMNDCSSSLKQWFSMMYGGPVTTECSSFNRGNHVNAVPVTSLLYFLVHCVYLVSVISLEGCLRLNTASYTVRAFRSEYWRHMLNSL